MWFKNEYKRLVTSLFRTNPEILSGIDLALPKRQATDDIIDRLVENEHKYQSITIEAMIDLASKSSFSDIERLEEPDRSTRLRDAKRAIDELKRVTQELSAARNRAKLDESEREEFRAAAAQQRKFSDDLKDLFQKFREMSAESDKQQRGRNFEGLLSDLFNIYDLEPRLAYVIATEQIDGSFTFNTDDYILEAKWLAGAASRADVDVFDMKVRRKGKNALGLFVSINGLTGDAVKVARDGTQFITMDGQDLSLVLEERLSLVDLLSAKRRHVNETGECFYPATRMLNGES